MLYNPLYSSPDGSYIIADRLHTVFAVLCDELHDGAAYDHSIGGSSHPGGLLWRRNAETDRTGDILCLLNQRNHLRHIGGDLLADAGHAHGGDAVDKAFRFLCDGFDPLVGGGGDQGD